MTTQNRPRKQQQSIIESIISLKKKQEIKNQYDEYSKYGQSQPHWHLVNKDCNHFANPISLNNPMHFKQSIEHLLYLGHLCGRSLGNEHHEICGYLGPHQLHQINNILLKRNEKKWNMIKLLSYLQNEYNKQ